MRDRRSIDPKHDDDVKQDLDLNVLVRTNEKRSFDLILSLLIQIGDEKKEEPKRQS